MHAPVQAPNINCYLCVLQHIPACPAAWRRRPGRHRAGQHGRVRGLRVAGVRPLPGARACRAQRGRPDRQRHEFHGRARVVHLRPAGCAHPLLLCACIMAASLHTASHQPCSRQPACRQMSGTVSMRRLRDPASLHDCSWSCAWPICEAAPVHAGMGSTACRACVSEKCWAPAQARAWAWTPPAPPAWSPRTWQRAACWMARPPRPSPPASTSCWCCPRLPDSARRALLAAESSRSHCQEWFQDADLDCVHGHCAGCTCPMLAGVAPACSVLAKECTPCMWSATF